MVLAPNHQAKEKGKIKKGKEKRELQPGKKEWQLNLKPSTGRKQERNLRR